MQPLEKLIPSLIPLIERIAYRYLGDKMDVEDIVQEVLLKLISSNDQMQPARIDSWIAMTSRNAAIDTLRRTRRRRRYEDQNATARFNTFVECDKPPFQIESKQIDWDSRQEIASALTKLPEQQREALVFSAAGYSYHEIAQIQNVALGTVRSRIHYARTKTQPLLSA